MIGYSKNRLVFNGKGMDIAADYMQLTKFMINMFGKEEVAQMVIDQLNSTKKQDTLNLTI